jgi:hypothetical protein
MQTRSFVHSAAVLVALAGAASVHAQGEGPQVTFARTAMSQLAHAYQAMVDESPLSIEPGCRWASEYTAIDELAPSLISPRSLYENANTSSQRYIRSLVKTQLTFSMFLSFEKYAHPGHEQNVAFTMSGPDMVNVKEGSKFDIDVLIHADSNGQLKVFDVRNREGKSIIDDLGLVFPADENPTDAQFDRVLHADDNEFMVREREGKNPQRCN